MRRPVSPNRHAGPRTVLSLHSPANAARSAMTESRASIGARPLGEPVTMLGERLEHPARGGREVLPDRRRPGDQRAETLGHLATGRLELLVEHDDRPAVRRVTDGRARPERLQHARPSGEPTGHRRATPARGPAAAGRRRRERCGRALRRARTPARRSTARRRPGWGRRTPGRPAGATAPMTATRARSAPSTQTSLARRADGRRGSSPDASTRPLPPAITSTPSGPATA